jgi:hypothetical protein
MAGRRVVLSAEELEALFQRAVWQGATDAQRSLTNGATASPGRLAGHQASDPDELAAKVAVRVYQLLCERGMPNSAGNPSRGGKESTWRDDETNARGPSGHTGSKECSDGGSRRWTPREMEAEADALLDILSARRKRRIGSKR